MRANVTVGTVMRTGLSGISKLTNYVLLCHYVHITGATPYNLNIMRIEHINGSSSYVARQHNGNAHIFQHRSNVRLATATRWGVEALLVYNFAVFYFKNGVESAMPKVVVNHFILGWNCYLHNNVFAFVEN